MELGILGMEFFCLLGLTHASLFFAEQRRFDDAATAAEILDLGCGRGIALRMMTGSYPKSRFLGIDLSHEAVAWANEQARNDSLANIRYEQADAAEFFRKARHGGDAVALPNGRPTG